MNTIFPCNKCNAVFLLKKEHSSHQKKCTGGNSNGKVTFLFKETNQTIVLEKNTEGLYVCYCSHKECPKKGKGYTSVEGLKKHMKKVKSHWIGIDKIVVSENAEVSK